MDRNLYRYFFERKMPASMVMVTTDDPESLKREQFTVNSEQGILRNMWVNVEQIQKAFNITNADSDKPKANPPGTFETAIKNLLNALN